MKHIKTIIFDLDGTLIHSAPDIHAAINSVLTDLGRDALSLSEVISFVGNGVEKLVERSLVATGGVAPELKADALAQFLVSYEADPSSRTKPYSGVVTRLEALKLQGLKLGICTNKPTGPARKICDDLDLSRHFDLIAGAELNVPKKPDPTPLLSVIEALGGRPENALYVGDSDVDQATANNAKVPFAFFTGGYLNAPLVKPLPAITFDAWSEEWTGL
jgi:phosphoglycolate phosphatase